MKHILITIFLALCSLAASAQVAPPNHIGMSGPNKIGIQSDKTSTSGVRMIYSQPCYWWPHLVGRKDLPGIYSTAFAQKDSIGVKYGITLTFKNKTPISFVKGGKALMKTFGDKKYNGEILYGCDEEVHTSTSFSPNLMNSATPVAHSVRSSDVYCHIVFSYEDILEMASNGLAKLRIETKDSYYELEFNQTSKLKNFYTKSFQEIKDRLETVDNSSFEDGF